MGICLRSAGLLNSLVLQISLFLQLAGHKSFTCTIYVCGRNGTGVGVDAAAVRPPLEVMVATPVIQLTKIMCCLPIWSSTTMVKPLEDNHDIRVHPLQSCPRPTLRSMFPFGHVVKRRRRPTSAFLLGTPSYRQEMVLLTCIQTERGGALILHRFRMYSRLSICVRTSARLVGRPQIEPCKVRPVPVVLQSPSNRRLNCTEGKQVVSISGFQGFAHSASTHVFCSYREQIVAVMLRRPVSYCNSVYRRGV